VTASYVYIGMHKALSFFKIGKANIVETRWRQIDRASFDMGRSLLIMFPSEKDAYRCESVLKKVFNAGKVPDCVARAFLPQDGNSEWFRCNIEEIGTFILDNWSRLGVVSVQDGEQRQFGGQGRGVEDTAVASKSLDAIEAQGELSLVERKVWNVLLANAQGNSASAVATIHTKELQRIVGWGMSKNTIALRDAVERLIAFGLLDGETLEGRVVYQNPNDTATGAKTLLRVARIDLGLQARFKKGYALALYENCLARRKGRYTDWLTVDHFRRVIGASSMMYDDFKRLSGFVVTSAVKEVNAASDICVRPEYMREGRSVVAIRFAFR